MIRHVIHRLMRLVVPPVDMQIRHQPSPLIFSPRGLEFHNERTIARIEHLHSLGVHYREQIEAAECECAELMGLDPMEGTYESEMARDIVGVGLQVPVVIQAIIKHRRENYVADL